MLLLSKWTPSTCLNPCAFNLPCSFLLLFFLHAQLLSIGFTPAGISARLTPLKTLFATILACLLSISSRQASPSGPFTASSYFMGQSSFVFSNPPPRAAPTLAYSVYLAWFANASSSSTSSQMSTTPSTRAYHSVARPGRV